jgi:hypothetical protein
MIRPKENICMCPESVNELLNSVFICFLYLLFMLCVCVCVRFFFFFFFFFGSVNTQN